MYTHWHVFLYGIDWDDGKGEYDTSSLPVNLRVTVAADGEDTEEEVLTTALDEATDAYGFLIEGTDQIVARQISESAARYERRQYGEGTYRIAVDEMGSLRRVK